MNDGRVTSSSSEEVVFFDDFTTNRNEYAPQEAVLPTVFQDADFKGLSLPLEAGVYTSAPSSIGDGTISSIKVPSGWKVTVFTDRDFKGASREITSDVANLGDLNDKISSLKVERS